MQKRSAAKLVAVAAAAVAVAGCGSSSSSSSGGGSSSSASTPAPATSSTPAQGSGPLTIEADPNGNLAFVQKTASAKASNLAIDFKNASPLPHNLTVALGTRVLGATPTFSGGSKSLTLHLTAGTYTFYCSVPGHRAAGMQGTLTVT